MPEVTERLPEDSQVQSQERLTIRPAPLAAVLCAPLLSSLYLTGRDVVGK